MCSYTEFPSCWINTMTIVECKLMWSGSLLNKFTSITTVLATYIYIIFDLYVHSLKHDSIHACSIIYCMIIQYTKIWRSKTLVNGLIWTSWRAKYYWMTCIYSYIKLIKRYTLEANGFLFTKFTNFFPLQIFPCMVIVRYHSIYIATNTHQQHTG